MFHLFSPVDEVRAKENAKRLKVEALEVCSGIMESLFESLPLEGVSSMTVGVTDLEPEAEGAGEEEELGQEEMAGKEEEGFGLVSDKERETDRAIRVRIFLALLKLACAMVSQES